MDDFDPLHTLGPPGRTWSCDNVGEAVPGVLTPLTASIWTQVGDRMMCAAVRALGVFSHREARTAPRWMGRIAATFYGRLAIQVEFVALLGDRMPGTTGQEAAANLFGRVPETIEFRPSMRRYPVIAVKLPVAMFAGPRRVRRLAGPIDAWWRTEIARLPGLDRAGANAVLVESQRRFEDAITTHTTALFAAVQPALTLLTALVRRAGVGDIGALGGSGGAEMAIVEDIWLASRGRLTQAEVVANHGFHGPLEGELSSRVWREDPAPVARVIREYAAMADEDSPVLLTRRAKELLPARQREVAARFPAPARPVVRALLRYVASVLPLRGVGKRSFLQTLDVTRAATRRLGEHLVTEGVLDDPDDGFYLTLEELTWSPPAVPREVVARRRARRAEFLGLSVPAGWTGLAEAVPARTDDGPAEGSETDTDLEITGIGVSSGVVEGVVRVVTDPGFAEVEPGEVLVTPTTDPSWASIMFVSAALVVDIGGMLSHAAVVARELGLPCVVNTRQGTRLLRTGDRVRVDGGAGTVRIIERAPPAGAAQISDDTAQPRHLEG